MSVRSARELLGALDVAYVLHHCHVDSMLRSTSEPAGVPADVVVARRHALEWASSVLPWDEVEMDT